MSEDRPFERVKDQIGYCGIWCGSCAGGNGVTQELTKRYEEFVKRNQIDKWAPKDFDLKEFMRGLGSIQKVKPCPGCREGGGAPECIIRACAKGKGYEYCYECGRLKDCDKFSSLEEGLPEIKKELQRLKGRRKETSMEDWTRELAGKWPSCILSCPAVEGK
jgi:hypothetical protein